MYYCSRDCQVSDWRSRHENICRKHKKKDTEKKEVKEEKEKKEKRIK